MQLASAGYAVLMLVASGSMACAADLARVDRTIKKEPVYKTKPKYCLLVFGPEARTRAWLVLDGDDLYIDRNGNGDLTDEGERVKARLVERERGAARVERYHFVDLRDPSDGKLSDENRDVPTLKQTNRYRRLSLSYTVQKPADDPGAFVEIYLWIDRALCQRGRARFASQPKDAPILHFDGPLTFEFIGPTAGFARGGHPTELMARLRTPGLGDGAVTLLTNFRGVPEEIHPTAVIEFPSAKSGERPLRVSAVLNCRC